MPLLFNMRLLPLARIFWLLPLLGYGHARYSQPNIVFVVADDLGWNDVSWNNPDILTPQLWSLAQKGVIFNQSYVLPVCTPSRTAFMTGYYPFRLGRQNTYLHPLEPTGVSTKYPFLAERLKELGYSTHAVGKWHLGYCNESYTPTLRGFDTFFGFYLGSGDYYNHTSGTEVSPVVGYDFRKNRQPTKAYTGIYSTHAFAKAAVDLIANHDARKPLFLYLPFQAVHSPLQVPQKYANLYPKIRNSSRKHFSGMVTAMDEAVGYVVSALTMKGIWQNTVFVFTTDNGGQTLYGGNNWPLRGNKGTLWEGGTRGPAFVYSSLFRRRGYVSNSLFHAVDWFPTLMQAAGGKPSLSYNLDGISQWESLVNGSPGPRTEFVYNIYSGKQEQAAIRVKNFKLLVGNGGTPDGWIPVPGISNKTTYSPTQTPPSKVQLFNLLVDPLEKHDVSAAEPAVTRDLLRRLRAQESRAVPADDPPPDPRGSPLNWGGFFSPGWCSTH